MISLQRRSPKRPFFVQKGTSQPMCYKAVVRRKNEKTHRRNSIPSKQPSLLFVELLRFILPNMAVATKIQKETQRVRHHRKAAPSQSRFSLLLLLDI